MIFIVIGLSYVMETETETKTKKKVRIRKGDLVQIVKPEMFIRCGYPLTVREVKASFYDVKGEPKEDERYQKIMEVFKSVGVDVDGSLSHEGIPLIGPRGKDVLRKKSINKIIDALAYEIVRAKGFGGNERKLYTKDVPALAGNVYRVCNKKVCVTGTYSPSSGSGYDYWGESDYEPATLDNAKTHVILSLDYVSEGEMANVKSLSEEVRNGINAKVFGCMWEQGDGIKELVDAVHLNRKHGWRGQFCDDLWLGYLIEEQNVVKVS